MIDRQEQEMMFIAAPLPGRGEQDLFLCLNSIPSLWPDLEVCKQSWKSFGQQIPLAGDIYAQVTARRSIVYEEQARERYHLAHRYHQRGLHCGAAMWLEKTIRLLACALQRWGYTAAWLKHLYEVEQASSPLRDAIAGMLLKTAQQQQELCATLNYLQRMYFAYCFAHALIPSLFEEGEEEDGL